MDVAQDQLVVRQHERRACKLPATVRIAPEHTASIGLARSVGDGTGCLSATVVDVSDGGTGLETQVFLPRGAAVLVVVQPQPGGPMIQISSRVQRVTMISREPRYYLGLSYAGDSAARASTLGRLIESLPDKPLPEQKR